MKIGIDVDDTIIEFMKGYLDFYNLIYKTSFKTEDVTNYHLWECGIHSSKEQSVLEVSKFQNSEFFDKLGLIEGAKEGIEKLSEKHNLYFITSRSPELRQKTIDFFSFHFPKNGYEFIFSGEVYGGEKKPEICRRLQIKYMIEDNSNYALGCAKEGIKVFLLEKPWNGNYIRHENITSVKNWREILEVLK